MAMNKPNQVLPSSPTSTGPFMPAQIADPSIRGASFDQLLANRGIRFIHRRAAPCPNMTSLDDSNHSPDCPACDDSGILYYDEKEITGVFQSNSIEKTFEQHGVWEIGSAVVTFPADYTDGTPADFNTFDELIIPDYTVRMWEMKQYELTNSGIQYARYPIEKVDFLSVVRNNEVIRFQEGIDFIITDGGIQWLPGKEPWYYSSREAGEVYTVAYYAYPVYKVLQPLRELRVTQEMIAGQKVAKRLPQQVLVRRDFLVGAGEKITDKAIT